MSTHQKKSKYKDQLNMSYDNNNDKEIFQLAKYEDIEKNFQEYCEMYSEKYNNDEPKHKIKSNSEIKFTKNNKKSLNLKPSMYQRLLHQRGDLKSKSKTESQNVSFDDKKLQYNTLNQIQDTDRQLAINDQNHQNLNSGFEKDSYVLGKLQNILGEQGVNKASDLPLNQKLLKEFDININHFMLFKTQEEKENYVITCIQNKLSEDYKTFLEKLENRERNQKEIQRISELNKVKVIKEKSDNFKWLNLKSNYDSLKKKLRTSLVEMINDFENQSKIQQTIEENQKSRLPRDRSIRIKLENIPNKLNTSLYMSDILNQTDSQSQKKNFSKFNRPSTASLSNQKKTALTDQTHQLIKLKNLNSTSAFMTSDPSNKTYEWEPPKENQFKQHREQAKKRMSSLVKSTSWNEVGFAPLIQASNLEENNKLQRQTKLYKYIDGELLNPEDMKYLANTNVLLNSCVDKNFYQKAVNILDNEVIEDIELNIAENIIGNYEQHKEMIQQARLNYLEQINQQTLIKAKSNSKRYEKKRQLEQSRFEQKRIKKRNEKYLKILDQKQIGEEHKQLNKGSQFRIQNAIHKRILAEDGNNNNDNIAANTSEHPDVHKGNVDQNKETAQRLYPQHIAKQGKDIRIEKFRLHPSSKIFLKDTEPNMNRSSGDHQVKKVNDHILHIHSPTKYRVGDNFHKFYSGGPPKVDEDTQSRFYDFKTQGPIKLTIKERKAAKKILALLQGWRQRKLYLRIKEDIKFKKLMQQQKEKDMFLNGFYQQQNSRPKFIPSKLLEQDNLKVKKIQKGLIRSQSRSKIIESDKKILEKKGTIRLDRQHSSTSLFIGSKNNNNNNNTQFGSPSAQNQQENFNQNNNFDFLSAMKSGINSEAKQRNPLSYTRLNNKHENLAQKLAQNPKVNTLKPNSDQQKTIFSIDIEEVERMEKIRKKAPTKSLLLKQKKMLQAAKQNKFHLVLSLGFLYYESDMNVKDEDGYTALYYAAKYGNETFIKFLIKNGANPNIRCTNNNTPMHAIFQSNNEMLIIYLLSKGGSLNILNDFGQSPIAFGNTALLKKLDLTNAIASVDKIQLQQAGQTVNNDNIINDRKTVGEKQENSSLNFGFKRLDTTTINSNTHEKKSNDDHKQAAVYSYLHRKNGERAEDEIPDRLDNEEKYQGNDNNTHKNQFQMQQLEIENQGGQLIAKLVLSSNPQNHQSPKIIQKGDFNNIQPEEIQKIKNKLLNIGFKS